MVIFPMPLCKDITISHRFVTQIVLGISFLVKHIATVFLVFENIADSTMRPTAHTLWRAYALFRQCFCNVLTRRTLQKTIVNITHDFSLGRLDFYPSCIITIVAEGVMYGKLVQTLLHPITDAFFDCEAFLLTFQFGKCRQNGNHQLITYVACVDTFLFKYDSHRIRKAVQFLQRGKDINNVASKTADTLYKDQVNFASLCILNHLRKAFTLFLGSAGYSFVRIDFYHLILWIILDEFLKVLHLHFKTTCLCIFLCADTAVCGSSYFDCCFLASVLLAFWLDDRYLAFATTIFVDGFT